DLFGRVRRSVQAANAQFDSVEAMRLDVLVSLTAEVARNYFELRGLQNQLAVARKNADVQTETLKITQSRLDGGRGTDFDVSRSRSLLNHGKQRHGFLIQKNGIMRDSCLPDRARKLRPNLVVTALVLNLG